MSDGTVKVEGYKFGLSSYNVEEDGSFVTYDKDDNEVIRIDAKTGAITINGRPPRLVFT
jgi:hypothetical protein